MTRTYSAKEIAADAGVPERRLAWLTSIGLLVPDERGGFTFGAVRSHTFTLAPTPGHELLGHQVVIAARFSHRSVSSTKGLASRRAKIARASRRNSEASGRPSCSSVR